VSATAETLWNRLRQEDVVDEGMPEETVTESPWYVRAMLGVAGWIAALFLLGFVAVGLEFVIKSETASIIMGLVALLAAYAILSAAANDFLQQFGLAVSFAGQALIVFGCGELLDWRGNGIWWLIALLQVVVAVVMPSFMQRLVAAFFGVYAFSVALEYHAFVVFVLATLVIALIWLKEFAWSRWGRVLRPVGYGMTLALVCLKGPVLSGQTLGFWYPRGGAMTLMIPPWVGELALGLLLVAVVARLMSRNNVPWGSRPMVIALFAAALVAGVSLEMSGIAVGLVVVLLGFSNSNRILVGLGIAALLFYVSGYYYALNATLLVKSGMLGAMGVALLSARWVLLKWVLPMKASSNA
jgi:hypothetical protein